MNEFDQIIQAIDREECVLFLGPNIADINGQDIQALFYENIDNELKQQTFYDKNERIWAFRSDTVRRKILKSLSAFYSEHKNDNKDLIKIFAEIPFHLIVSLIPDETVNEIFEEFNVGQNFDYFKRQKIDCEVPTKQNPLIYNLFGNIRNRDYLLSHHDFHEFVEAIMTIGLPDNLKDALIRSNYYIFIGFDFNKWHNILLLYILNKIKSDADKFAIDNQKADNLLQKLIDENLNIKIIDDDYTNFINNLRDTAIKKGVIRKLQTEKEKIASQLAEKQEYIDFLKEEYALATDPRQKFRMKRDIEKLQKEIDELLKKIKK